MFSEAPHEGRDILAFALDDEISPVRRELPDKRPNNGVGDEREDIERKDIQHEVPYVHTFDFTQARRDRRGAGAFETFFQQLSRTRKKTGTAYASPQKTLYLRPGAALRQTGQKVPKSFTRPK